MEACSEEAACSAVGTSDRGDGPGRPGGIWWDGRPPVSRGREGTTGLGTRGHSYAVTCVCISVFLHFLLQRPKSSQVNLSQPRRPPPPHRLTQALSPCLADFVLILLTVNRL